MYFKSNLIYNFDILASLLCCSHVGFFQALDSLLTANVMYFAEGINPTLMIYFSAAYWAASA